MHKVMFIYGLLLLSVIMGGCSKSPKAYNPNTLTEKPFIQEQAIPTDKNFEKALMVDVDGKTIPAIDVLTKPISTENIEGGFAYDAKVKANSSRDIVYKEGAGGLTFNTTLTDAESILSKPRQGPDVDGYAFYDEGLYILWRKDDPRTPRYILVLQNYLGAMRMPVPLEPVGMGYDFSKKGYAKTQEGAEKIALDYYRILENKPADYNCIAQITCLVTWGDESKKDVVIEIPGKLLWLISKDRFVLYRMLILEPLPVIPFNLNMLAGDFMVTDQQSIAMGQAYSEIEKVLSDLLKINPLDIKTNVNVESFGRQYDGTALLYQKTDFDRKSKQPKDSDKLKMIQVWGSYPGLMTLNGKPIVVSETVQGVDLRIADSVEEMNLVSSPDRRELALVVNIGLQKQNVPVFAQKFKDLLEDQIKQAYPSSLVVSQLSGFYQKKTIKEYNSYTLAFDQAKNEGLFVQFGIEEEHGNITSFTSFRLGGELNPVDPTLFKDIATPIEKVMAAVPLVSLVDGKNLTDANGVLLTKQDKLPTFTRLSGISLGDLVRVTDWDLGRSEATVAITLLQGNPDSQGQKLPVVRADYYERDVITVAYSDEKTVAQDVSTVSVGSLGVTLGLKLIQEADVEVEKKTSPVRTRTYKVVSVNSNLNVSSVKDLCSQKFNPSFGVSAVDFMSTLSTIKGCKFIPAYDGEGARRLLHVYFPEDRIRLSFADEALVSATIYTPNSEVQ